MSDEVLYSQWEACVPRDLFDILFLVTGRNEFVDALMVALGEGRGGDFIDRFLADHGYGDVYMVRAHEQEMVKQEDRAIWSSFRRKRLNKVSRALEGIESEIENLEDNLEKDLYRRRIDEVYLLSSLEGKLHTRDFTCKQFDNDMWVRLIDWKQSKESGKLVLPFEHIALELLERTSIRDHQPMSFSRLMDIMNFSENEIKFMGVREVEVLDFDEVCVFFRVLLNRLGLGEVWRVRGVPTLAAITVNSKSREIMIPLGIVLTPDEMLYLCVHELVHVLRGENGYLQPWQIGLEGVGDYILTEEGLATVVELLKGQTIAHPRRRLLAARYLAIGMAVKADNESAVYEYQEIYDRLVGLEIHPVTAARLVWRFLRGTSLKHEVGELDLVCGEERLCVPVAEAFVKDIVYFHGQLLILRWLVLELAEDKDFREYSWMERLHSDNQSEWYENLDDVIKAGVFIQGADVVKVKKLIDRILVSKLDLRYFSSKELLDVWYRGEGFVSIEGVLC